MEYSDVILNRHNVFLFGGSFTERQHVIRQINQGKETKQDGQLKHVEEIKPVFRHENCEVFEIQLEKRVLYLWNFSNKKISQGIAQLFITKESVALIIADSKDTDKLTQIWKDIAFRGIKCVFVLSKTGNEEREETIQLFKELDEKSVKVSQEREHTTQYISADTKNICSLLESQLVTEDIRPDNEENLLKVARCIQEHVNNQVVFHLLDDIQTQADVSDSDFSSTSKILANKGIILTFENHQDKHKLLCVNPLFFLKILLTIHIDSFNKTFRIPADRFWPKRRPDGSSLVQVLEDIPSHGLIRQCLLPLLWQDTLTNKEQINLVTNKLEELGFMVPYKKNSMFSEVLCLIEYPFLSSVDQMSLVLMEKMNDIKPSLNWYEELQNSDIQLTIRLLLPMRLPTGFQERYMGSVCYCYKHVLNYQYGWKSGLLLRIQDIYLYLSIKSGSIDIFVRTDVDMYPSFDEACQDLWLTLTPSINCFFGYLTLWPCLPFEIEVFASGNDFRTCRNLNTNSLSTLIKEIYIKSGSENIENHILFPFQDFKIDEEEYVLQEWFMYLSTESKKIKSSMCPQEKGSLMETTFTLQKKSSFKKKNKGKDLTWKIKENRNDMTMSDNVLTADRKHNLSVSPNKNSVTICDKTVHTGQTKAVTEHAAEHTKQGENYSEGTEWQETYVESFVAAVIASGVACYIKEECMSGGKWTKYQAAVATEMSEAIMLVNSKDILAAAKTIIHAVDKVGGSEKKETKGCCPHGSICYCGQNKSYNLDSRSKLSSVCSLL